jgi:hypothetical protein
MGLFQTTSIVFIPVKVVTANPVGGIIMIILAFVFWKVIFTVVAAIVALSLLIGLIGWYNELSEYFSVGAKIIGHLVIVAAVVAGYAVVHKKINGNDLFKKEFVAIESEKLAKDSDFVEDATESESNTDANNTPIIESTDNSNETKEVPQEQIKTEENKISESTKPGVISSTSSEGFYSDGVSYFFEYKDTLYQANDIVFKSNSKMPENFNFYYIVGNEITQKTVTYNENGKTVKRIDDQIIRHEKVTSDPRFYTASAVLLFGMSLVAFSLLKGRTKKEENIANYKSSAKPMPIAPSPATEPIKANFDSNRVRSKVIEEDGFLSIVFEPAISQYQVEQLREFINGLPKSNHKKIRINGEGQNIRTLDQREVKLIIDFLETMSVFTKNKSKFHH